MTGTIPGKQSWNGSHPERTFAGSAAGYLELVKGMARRSILHVDLAPFLVAVERRFDRALVGRAVIVGGAAAAEGIVAAASEEARARGIRPGQSLEHARKLCPRGAFCPGDLEAYARTSEEVTDILLRVSRRVERPSADEAFLDVTMERAGAGTAVAKAESVKTELEQTLRIEASLGLAASRLAARVASGMARPRGLLVVLPGYESSFVAPSPIEMLDALSPHDAARLRGRGYETLGNLAGAPIEDLTHLLGRARAERCRTAALGQGEPPIERAKPPETARAELTIRDLRTDRVALIEALDGLVERAFRRVRPFGLGAGAITIEMRRADDSQREHTVFHQVVTDSASLRQIARGVAAPMLDSAAHVRGLAVQLSRLAKPSLQSELFPDGWHATS